MFTNEHLGDLRSRPSRWCHGEQIILVIVPDYTDQKLITIKGGHQAKAPNIWFWKPRHPKNLWLLNFS